MKVLRALPMNDIHGHETEPNCRPMHNRMSASTLRQVIACCAIALSAVSCAMQESAPKLAFGRVDSRASARIEGARSAWTTMALHGVSAQAIEQYNAGAAELVKDAIVEAAHAVRVRQAVQTAFGTLSVRSESRGLGEWDIDRFNSIKLATDPPTPGLINEPGIGAPVLARCKPEIRNGIRDPGYPARGQYVPATAWVGFENDARRVALHLADPRAVRTIPIGKRLLPLASNVAATERSNFREKDFLRLALGGFFRPGNSFERREVFLVEPYSPQKIPVILVHGLASEPNIWENLATAIESDPELSKRMQIWCFSYPTGPAVPSSAYWFRRKLAEVRDFHDPRGQFAAERNTVIVGHSMGGILTQMMAIDSGEDFRRAYYRKPLEEIRIGKAARKLSIETLYFHPQPGVRRVVFICTPHRGSALAQTSIGRLANSLIQLPFATLNTALHIATLNRDALNPELMRFRNLGSTSIDTLSPLHPYFKALNARPIAVPFHSIIGNRGVDGPIEASSDGVVAYRSSHLDGAVSEKIVPYWHSCVEKPETVAEVVRILRLHAGLKRYN